MVKIVEKTIKQILQGGTKPKGGSKSVNGGRIVVERNGFNLFQASFLN